MLSWAIGWANLGI